MGYSDAGVKLIVGPASRDGLSQDEVDKLTQIAGRHILGFVTAFSDGELSKDYMREKLKSSYLNATTVGPSNDLKSRHDVWDVMERAHYAGMKCYVVDETWRTLLGKAAKDLETLVETIMQSESGRETDGLTVPATRTELETFCKRAVTAVRSDATTRTPLPWHPVHNPKPSLSSRAIGLFKR